MKFDFVYDLTGAGWAEAIISAEDHRVQMTASYLSDALGDLTQAIVDLFDGEQTVSTFFMDEPGEHRMSIMKIDGGSVLIEIDRFNDWLSWELDEEKNGERVFAAEVELIELASKIEDSLERIFAKFGIDGYKEKWIEHDFPIANQEKLKTYLKTSVGN